MVFLSDNVIHKIIFQKRLDMLNNIYRAIGVETPNTKLNSRV